MIKTSTKSFIVTNIILKKILFQTMQMMFGSIISLQILAHLLLANIRLPANTLQCFDIMIQIVSFDYFDLDFDLTPTEPWSEQFDNLGYGSSNFFENMGSIMVYMWFGAVYILVVLVLHRLKVKCYSWLKDSFSLTYTWESTILFLQGTFFEVMVSLTISMTMFELWEYLTLGDKISIVNQLAVAVIMVAFILFVTYFSVFKIRKIITLKKVSDQEKNDEIIQKVRSEFKANLKSSKSSAKNTSVHY